MPQHRRASLRVADRSSAANTELARADGLAGCKSRVLAAFTGSKVPDKTGDLPRFDIDELELGEILGKGQFGTISEVLAFTVKGPPSAPSSRRNSRPMLQKSLSYRFGDDTSDSTDEERSSKFELEEAARQNDMEARAFLAKHALKDGERARYAVKVLSNNVMCDTESFLQGITDMAVETRLLSNMNHPNIIKLRAHARVEAYNEYYFIVMDRLYDSLEQRLQQWDQRMRRANPGFRRFFRRSSGRGLDKAAANPVVKELYKEKIQVAHDLADALVYVHKLHIVYRDIKTENVGFDIRGDVRLFDFGLAKELRSEQMDANGTYKLTQLGLGLEGNPKYIAPEVSEGIHYNEKCDSYSFAILMWQIMSCQTPYEEHSTVQSFQENVWSSTKEERPEIDEYWQTPMKLLLKRSWCHDLHARNSMENICTILRAERIAIQNGDDTSLDHIKRRSTFVFHKDGDEEEQDILSEKRKSKSSKKSKKAEKKAAKKLAENPRASFALANSNVISSNGAATTALPVDPRSVLARSSKSGVSRRFSSKQRLEDEDSAELSAELSVASNSTTMTAAERRAARQRSFEEHAKKKVLNGKKSDEPAERQVRRSSIGSTYGLSNMGGLDLPAGVVAATEVEEFADIVHSADRDTIRHNKLIRQGSSRGLGRQGSSRGLSRQGSSRGLSRQGSVRSLSSVGSTSKSKSKLRRGRRGSTGGGSVDSNDDPIEDSLSRQSSTRSLESVSSSKSKSKPRRGRRGSTGGGSVDGDDDPIAASTHSKDTDPLSVSGHSRDSGDDDGMRRSSRRRLKKTALVVPEPQSKDPDCVIDDWSDIE